MTTARKRATRAAYDLREAAVQFAEYMNKWPVDLFSKEGKRRDLNLRRAALRYAAEAAR